MIHFVLVKGLFPFGKIFPCLDVSSCSPFSLPIFEFELFRSFRPILEKICALPRCAFRRFSPMGFEIVRGFFLSRGGVRQVSGCNESSVEFRAAMKVPMKAPTELKRLRTENLMSH